MRLIRVGAAVLNQTPLAWERNRAHILAAIEQARAARVSLLCLPEMCICGYGCEDSFLSPGVQETSLELLGEIAASTRGLVVSVGLPVAYQHGVYNAAALLVDGAVAGLVCKQALAGHGVYYEPRWFKPWPAGVRSELDLAGRTLPIGDLRFDVGGVRLGFEICEDAWAARRPGSDLSLAATDVIFNPSASHFAFGKLDVRKRIVLEGARAFGVSYVYANLLGNEAGRILYDGGALIASQGRLVAAGPRFAYQSVLLTDALVDVDSSSVALSRLAAFEPSVVHDGRLVAVGFDYPPAEPEWLEPSLPAWEVSPHIKEEEFTRAVAMGLFDYMRKSWSGGYVVSTSGGADSSAVACLVALMVRLATRDLGLDGLKARLGHLPAVNDAASERELTGRLLTTVYQATENSSEVTRGAARAVAEAVGSRHLELDVQGVVEAYVSRVSAAIGRRLDWAHDDTTLQNIQARSRSPSVWMLANLGNALLLATSNRSEAAVGYATMDGDTSGGLSPIAGIDKAYLRRWLRWLETTGPSELGPIPALAAVNAQQPTAELRPPEARQTDEDDLMPYEVLDVIERLAINDKRAPLEVYRIARARFPELRPAELGLWVERFFRLWCRNQWKRERYAPSFHLDDENLDPKTSCRFPILSGGFEREIEALRRHIAEADGAPGTDRPNRRCATGEG